MRRWLIKPICARKVLWQCGQGMVAAAGELFALSFLTCRRCTAAAVLLASQSLAPFWTEVRQQLLSCAAISHASGQMSKALRDALRLSLKRFFGAPRERFPSTSSPKRSCLGSRWSGMRATWPAQRSCACMSMVKTLGRPARSSTSVSGTLSCHLTPRSFLRLVVWKWFSLFAWRW